MDNSLEYAYDQGVHDGTVTPTENGEQKFWKIIVSVFLYT